MSAPINRDSAVNRILLVDDEANVLKALRRVLAPERYEIELFEDPQAALIRAAVERFDLVLSDYRMPRMDGVEFLGAFKDVSPDTVRLILSGYADLDALMGAINHAEIYRFISKPWQDYDLKATLADALRHRDMLLENRRLADRVRAQEALLYRHERELERLEREHPGITRVDLGRDGSILLDDTGTG
jgi:DNA-binding NtrC family response regulator